MNKKEKDTGTKNVFYSKYRLEPVALNHLAYNIETKARGQIHILKERKRAGKRKKERERWRERKTDKKRVRKAEIET